MSMRNRLSVTVTFGAMLPMAFLLIVACGGCESTPTPAPQPQPSGPAPATPEVSQAPVVKANPETVQGSLDLVKPDLITGWAMDTTKPNRPVEVELYDGETLLASVSANEFRQDLMDAGKGDGLHAFNFAPPASLKDGKEHTIHAKCAGVELPNSPKTLTVR